MLSSADVVKDQHEAEALTLKVLFSHFTAGVNPFNSFGKGTLYQFHERRYLEPFEVLWISTLISAVMSGSIFHSANPILSLPVNPSTSATAIVVLACFIVD